MPRFALAPLALLLVLGACTGGAQVTTTPPPIVPERPPLVLGPEAPPAPPADASAAAALDPDTVSFSRFDTGRMWTFDNPPRDYLRETYGLTPDDAWFQRARLGALRLPNCSASFVSPEGLILTNHHCAREAITAATRDGENLKRDGFYAATGADERRIEDLHVDQLVEIVDVTERMETALARAQTTAERMSVRNEEITRIQDELAAARGGEGSGIRAQVIEFYSGGAYSAYIFRRYEDIRLVLAPETAVGYFGGDPDNFTYPRYTLDFTLFRAYGTRGEPLDTRLHYFPWSASGSEDGEVVFVVGNPGSTTRLQTVAELLFRRDTREPALLRAISSRADVFQAYVEAHPDAEGTPELRDTYFSLSNARKAYTGRVQGLNDPYIIARRRAAERAFAEAIQADPALREAHGDVLDRIARNRTEARELRAEAGAFLGMNPGSILASNVLGRALFAYAHGMTGSPGFRRAALAATEERPEALEVAMIQAKMEDLVHYLGSDDPVVRQVLQGRTPAEAARALYDGTRLVTNEGAERMLGAGNVTTSNDPAIAFARAIYPRFSDFQQRSGALDAQLGELSRDLARARFAIFGTDIPPDATFSLRINDGVVRGYPYNGTVAPSYTTFWGMYDRHHSHAGTDLAEFFELPEAWLPAPEGLDLSTPYNFVTTNDIIGGNSGSPMLNRNLEIVGVAFDGNIESLPGDFIYLGELNRTVGVDSRAMLHAMDVVYRADRIVRELGGTPRASAPAASDPLAGTAWRLTALPGGLALPDTENEVPYLRFDADAGRVSGSGGCNRLAGGYTRSGGEVSFSQLGATRMHCEGVMEQEQAFLEAVERAARWEAQGELLRLLDASGTTVAEFAREG